MLERLQDRRLWSWLIFTLVFLLLGFRLAQLTIIEGEELAQRALDTRLKKTLELAKRGEITDRNNVLLAGNETSYSLHFLFSQQFNADQERMTINLFKLLKEYEEQSIGLPIIMREDGFVFEADLQKKQWLEDYGFSMDSTARDVFEAFKEQEQISADLDAFAAQQILILKGIYLPIRVRNMEFTYDFNRRTFLEYYNIDASTNAKDAFWAIRNFFRINEKYNNEEAYYIAIMRHAIRQKGYLKYEPIVVAQNVNKEVAVLISEQNMQYPNVSVEIQPVRYYPHSNLASHVLGYLGRISSASELERFNESTGYVNSELIGKIGIEGRFENVLKGTHGTSWIEVNAYGRFVRALDESIPDERFISTPPVAGKSVQLTIDIELQEAVRDYLERTLEAIQTGGVYASEYGDYRYTRQYANANTGAVVVVDVKSGEVLSLVSYPDYDLNLFSKGITNENWRALNVNSRDPLAPRPLYNIATLTAVQPGSTFKMVTGFAALLEGLNPNTRYRDAGFISTKDGRTFGCWLWNRNRGTHGFINLMEAIEVSCNYYFFSVANGYDYAAGKKMPFDMNADKIIEAAKLFGLNEASGVEIGERVLGVPDAAYKQRTILNLLRYKLRSIGPDYFSEELVLDEARYGAVIDAIIDLGRKTPEMSRNAVIRFLQTEGGISDINRASNLADIIKYSYFNQVNWYEGDTFNLAIGQGGHAYTPVQMVKYIAAIANGGYLYNLTLVKSVDGEPADRQPFKHIDYPEYIASIQQGMKQVADGPRGSVTSQFRGFPMSVGAKTGTAEKSGKLPPEDEEDYLLTYLKRIAPGVSQNDLELETAKVLKERTDHIAFLYKILNETDEEAVRVSTRQEISNLSSSDYLSRGLSMREALRRISPRPLTNETIDQFKPDYDNFTWFVAYAPYDNPEIAVSILIPQGGTGGNGAAIAKDIFGKYFNLSPTGQ
jgi:penicillin-binding protein 2